MSGTKTKPTKITGPNVIEQMKHRVMEEHDRLHTEHVREILMQDYAERQQKPKSPK